MKTIRVLIAGGHSIGRIALQRLLEPVPDLAAIEGSSDVAEIERRCREVDLVLWDSTAEPYTPDDLRPLLAAASAPPVVILGALPDTGAVVAWVRAGATGYIPSDIGPAEFAALLRQAGRGDPVFPPSLAAEVIRHLATAESAARVGGHKSLSDREMDIIRLLATGATNKRIAQSLYISVRTVEGHLASIYGKLGVNTRTEAALIAVRKGWIGNR